MNGYLRAMIAIPNGYAKLLFAKIFHPKGLKFGRLPRISPNTEISLDRKSTFSVGKKFNMRSGAKIRVRKDAKLTLGKNVSISHNCIITCHEKISIGDNAQISPGVLIYDHDHDFRADGGLNAGKFITSPIEIGKNVWIGANTIILRGAKIGDNCVIAAGSIVGKEIPDNTVLIQKRESTILPIGNDK